jgi:hypothetical protein
MAGFQLTLYGRIWVTPKDSDGASDQKKRHTVNEDQHRITK